MGEEDFSRESFANINQENTFSSFQSFGDQGSKIPTFGQGFDSRKIGHLNSKCIKDGDEFSAEELR